MFSTHCTYDVVSSQHKATSCSQSHLSFLPPPILCVCSLFIHYKLPEACVYSALFEQCKTGLLVLPMAILISYCVGFQKIKWF